MTILQKTLLFSVIFLVGCAPKETTLELTAGGGLVLPKGSPVEKSANLVTSWDLSGAIAARNSKKAWTASIHWVQQGSSQYNIRLFGPLGGGTVLIMKQGQTITYQDGPKKASSTNADELLQQQSGVRLPVNNLYYWVRGLPAPGAIQSAERDPNNRLIALKQAGYVISYTEYASTTKGVALPTKIRLQGNGVLIKLVIKRWNY